MSQRGKTVLKGHSLLDEGAAYSIDGCRIWYTRGDGHGKCSCGALSDPLPSNSQRKQWHRDHKELVRQQQEGGR